MNMISSPTIVGAELRQSSLLVSPRSVLMFLSVIIAVLGLLHLISLPIYLMSEAEASAKIGSGNRFFMLQHERSAGTWFSTVLIAVNAVLLILNASLMRQFRLGRMLPWLCLAAIFAFLSMDEMFSLHERIGGAVARHFALYRFMNYPWVVTGAAFTMVVGLSFLRFLMRLPSRTARLIIVSGAIYVGGALGVEIIESITATHLGTGTFYYLLTLVEECMEMFGQALFAYALLDHISRYVTSLRLSPI